MRPFIFISFEYNQSCSNMAVHIEMYPPHKIIITYQGE
jgi:hypothetical protein